jgi:hypothetical protein
VDSQFEPSASSLVGNVDPDGGLADGFVLVVRASSLSGWLPQGAPVDSQFEPSVSSLVGNVDPDGGLADGFVLVVRASSLSGWLPQGAPVDSQFEPNAVPSVGAGLPAMAICQSPNQQRPIIIGFTRRTFPTVTRRPSSN